MKKPRNRRIALAVPEEAAAVLQRLSKATNTPMTTIITNLLMETLPSIVQVLDAIQQAKQGQQELAVKTLGDFLEKATTDLGQARLDLDELKGKNDASGK